MHSKGNAQISEKKDQKPCIWYGVLTAHPWFLGAPIPEIAINQGTIDLFSASRKIASGQLIGLFAGRVTGGGVPFLKSDSGNWIRVSD